MEAPLKKNILIGILIVAMMLLMSALGVYVYFQSQFSVYQDDQNKFSIKYPKTWKVVVHPKPNVAVVFLRSKDTAMDMIQENFNVTIQPLPDSILSLNVFSATVKKQMTAVFGKNMNLVQDKSLRWGWREGHQIEMQEVAPNHLRLINAWVLRSNQVCILTFLGDINKSSKDNLLVNEMIHSLQLQ